MSRNKNPYNPKVLRIIEKIKKNKEKFPNQIKPIKIWARASTITEEMIGQIFDIHKGNGFVRREIKPEMIGHKIGELALTRKYPNHGHAGTR